MKILSFIITVFFSVSCSDNMKHNANYQSSVNGSNFFYGADLSYVNEMEDCGAIYKNKHGVTEDVYSIFKKEGANLIRLRLWHNPKWTNYSNYQDVKKSIYRAKKLEMQVLLDFHYSDHWTDPSSQQIPAAWLEKVDDTSALGKILYQYTYNTLNDLANSDLLPDIVQVGNEINAMILQDGELKFPIDWKRNSYLINKGIKAVRDIAKKRDKNIEVMLHIAQPENALLWFEKASVNNIIDYDWIGLSYYPIWSEYTLQNVFLPLKSLIETYDKKLMIVETAYPFTLNNADTANNILGSKALIDNFPASEQGQLDYLIKLKNVIIEAGGKGLIYWEPAWVSTKCYTKWGQGSHWDNATLFDNDHKTTKGIEFYNENLNKLK